MQPGTKLANPTAEESKEEDEEVVSLAEKMFGDKRPSVDTQSKPAKNKFAGRISTNLGDDSALDFVNPGQDKDGRASAC